MPVSVAASDGLDAKTLRDLAELVDASLAPTEKVRHELAGFFSPPPGVRAFSPPLAIAKIPALQSAIAALEKSGIQPRLPRPHSNV